MNDFRTARAPTLTLLPFPLPAEFLARIGYAGPDHLVGLYGLGTPGGLAVYDRSRFWARGPDPRPWCELVDAPRVHHWLAEHYIYLGDDPATPPTHHLVVLRGVAVGFLAPAAAAMRIVQLQRW